MKNEFISEMKINPKSDQLVWKENTKWLCNNAKLTVSMGCEAVSLINGAFERIYTPGIYTVNEKSRKKEIETFELYGINKLQRFAVEWGVGKVPYMDRVFDLSCEVGAHGQMEISVARSQKLMTVFGVGTPVTPDMVKEKVIPQLFGYAQNQLAGLLEEYDYYTVTKGLEKFSDALQKKAEQILEEYGIILESFEVSSFHFSDDYQEEVQRILKERREREAITSEDRRRMREERKKDDELKRVGELLKNINIGFRNVAVAEEKSAVCGKCGKPKLTDAHYCPYCGHSYAGENQDE